MDKVKTGELIREARKAKNYTQNELGDMLGVTNKAVSRWEKGESFPDVAILENLAQILDLKIQEIVTGEAQTNDGTEEDTATEILRIATVQIRSKKKRIVGITVAIVVVFCSMLAGLMGTVGAGFMFDDSSGMLYYLMMISTLVAVVYGGYAPAKENTPLSGIDKLMSILSIVSYAWMIIMTWSVSILVVNGHIPFGMGLENVGPFINTQLMAVIAMNLLFLIVEIARMGSEFKKLHFGFVFQTASLYMAALYGDLLHRLSSFDGYIDNLATRTIICLICTVAALIVMKMTKKTDETSD